MKLVRHLLAQRQVAVLICAATLLLKLLVPTGYMVEADHGRLTLAICSGMTPQTMVADAPDMHGGMPGHGTSTDHGKSKDHGKPELPCAFAGLSAAALGAIDPIQVVALIAFIMAAGFAGAVLPALSRQPYLRPPLRGPPRSL